MNVDCKECSSIVADPMHIKQLWTNLISNAIKYTEDGGRVDVRLFPKGDEIVGEIKDTGIGIAVEDLPHLFSEFYRTERAKSFAQHGTGLGLSIVKQVLEEYGGDIQVHSILDEGTRFTFRLPVKHTVASTPQ